MEKFNTQYEVLQARINLHGSRMWQLPFTYLTLIGVIVSLTVNETPNPATRWIFLGLVIVGVILLGAWYGAFEGYKRTAANMRELELKLEIGDYTRCYTSHYLPYVLLILVGIGISVLVFVALQ